MKRISLFFFMIILFSVSFLYPQDLLTNRTIVRQFNNVKAEIILKESTGIEDAELRIIRNGNLVFDEHLGEGARFFDEDFFNVIDLNQDSEPEILVSFFYGGKFSDESIYYYNPKTLRYSSVDIQGEIKDLDNDGVMEIVWVDSRYYNSSLCWACQIFPPMIKHYVHGDAFADVTPYFPQLVEKEAKELSQRIKTTIDETEKKQAIWVWLTDMYLLGRGNEAVKQLKSTSYLSEEKIKKVLELLEIFGYKLKTSY